MKIFIDAGHGGTDPGAVSLTSDLTEANVNLDVAKRLEKILKSRGYETKMSRTTDTYVSLVNRAYEANKWKADCFISIHCNSAESRLANGTETLYYIGSKKGKLLAEDVQDQLVNQLGLKSRGVKERNLAVLRLTTMPAALTELAFISNAHEAELLGTPSFRQKAAQGIADGLQVYLKR